MGHFLGDSCHVWQKERFPLKVEQEPPIEEVPRGQAVDVVLCSFPVFDLSLPDPLD